MDFKQLRTYLHRAGEYQYLWSSDTKLSIWDSVEKDIAIPPKKNMFFGVHPSRVVKSSNERSKIVDVSAISCVFGDYDFKMFESKDKTAERIRSVQIKPTVVVSSGGGYHAYWIFKEPFICDTDNSLNRARYLQDAWVGFVGCDKGAKDLARVLRVPGTINYKPDYAPNFPEVRIVFSDLTRLYSFEQIESVIPKPKEQTVKRTEQKFGNSYLETALKNESEKIMRSQNGYRNDQLNRSAFALGKLIGIGMSRSRAEGTLFGAALAVGLSEQEAMRTIKSGLDSGVSKE